MEPSDGPLHVRELEMDGRRIVLAANGTEDPIRASFRLREGNWGETVRVMFERRTAELTADLFRDEFAPLATHVYELTPR